MSYSLRWTLLHVLSLLLRSTIVAWVRYCMMNFIGLTGIFQACSDSSSVSEHHCTWWLLHLVSEFCQPSSTCSTTFAAKHLRLSGLFSCQPYGLCWILSGNRRSVQIVSDNYSKDICSHDTSGSSTLGILDDNALHKFTYLLTTYLLTNNMCRKHMNYAKSMCCIRWNMHCTYTQWSSAAIQTCTAEVYHIFTVQKYESIDN